MFRDGTVVPSVTTCLSAVGDPSGLINWHVEQTALFCVTHVDAILNRTEEAGVRYAQYFSRRRADSPDDPYNNPYTAAENVLTDLADTGNYIHQYVEDDLNDRFPLEPVRADHVEMVEAWHEWRRDHDVEVLATEATVFGDGYAGTGDLWATVDGVPMLIDVKSSRKVGNSHIGQLAALGACDTMAVEVSEGTEGAVYHKLTPAVAAQHGGQVDTWWVPKAVPAFEKYGILQLRPSDYHRTTGEYLEPFCELHTISQPRIDAGWKWFQAGLAARHAEKAMKLAEKEDK